MLSKKMILLCLLLMGIHLAGQIPRIKDIAQIEGIRENQLMGMGLVVGLRNTGDRSEAALKALRNLLKRYNFQITESQLAAGNVALVMVTANLPALSRKGSRIDITASSIGDAKSLFGGTLLATFLKGLDQNVYVVAQGYLSPSPGLPTVAAVTEGGIVEREVPTSWVSEKQEIHLRLNNPDFNTAARVSEAINKKFSGELPCSYPIDMTIVKVLLPERYRGKENIARFVAEIMLLPVLPEVPARVVIQEQTGTVVMGDSIAIHPVTIVHNQITIRIQGDDKGITTVQKLVSALSALQVSSKDVIQILHILKKSGALHAELILVNH
ncbi:MAG: flagellar basal body P-ring protein FlgI [Candidatus Brocadiae bacterium]|nr:flagellar basal body P-ring protein FlgI [Candidatus Brocadiia bacterium]